MSPTVIIIIVVIVVVCVVGMIIAMRFTNATKAKAKSFTTEALQSGAVVNFYGEIISIDGNKKLVKGQDFVTGGDLQAVIRLTPGSHHVVAKFSVVEARLGGNKTFETDKMDFDLSVEQGVEYTFGVRDEQGDPAKTVFSTELRTRELVGRTKYLTLEKM